MTDKPTSRRKFLDPRALKRAMEDGPLELPETSDAVPVDASEARASEARAAADDEADDCEVARNDARLTARSEAYTFHISRQAMACEFSVIFNDGQDGGFTEAGMELLDLVEELEAEMTVYRDSSRIMEINRSAVDAPVFVGPRLFRLLQKSIELHAFTDGAFDITAGALSKVWGFYRRQGIVPDPDALAEALERVGIRWLTLDTNASEVRLLKQGVEINLGGIGKGFALDECASRFADYQIENCLMHGGQSSILARGDRAGIRKRGRKGWPINLRHPIWQGKLLAEIYLRDRALGTSGTGRQGFVHKGRRYGHIIDPRNGMPADGVLSSTVLAPTAAEADALATSFYVLGPTESKRLCEQRPEIAMIMVTPGKRQGGIEVHTANLKDEDWQRLDG